MTETMERGSTRGSTLQPETGPRVLISAYACLPGKSSESGVGWWTVSQIARRHETWVLTQGRNRQTIEAYATSTCDAGETTDPVPEWLGRVHWLYVDGPSWLVALSRIHALRHFHYWFWQWWAYLRARRANREVQFDLVHHVTYVNFWLPSYLSRLGLPLVWGPVGGGEDTPRSFYRCLPLRGRMAEHLRDLARWLFTQFPAVRRTARSASIALATTKQTGAKLEHLGARRVEVCTQVGLSAEDIEKLASLPLAGPSPVRFVSIGRLLTWKGFELGLQAFALALSEVGLADSVAEPPGGRQADLARPELEYWVIGDGPERTHLEAVTRRLGLSPFVRFFGVLPRATTFERLAECHVLVNPSLHDSGGIVCAEALAAGRPVICLDLGGPGLQVTPECGVPVPAKDPTQAVRSMADAMRHLAVDPGLRAAMGEKAQERVGRLFNLEARGQALAAAYEKAVGRLPE